MYSVNRLSIHSFYPSEPYFQGFKHLILYLYVCPHRLIIYPAVLDGATTHDLRQEVSPGDFHSQKISNGLVAFEYGVEGRDPNDKHAISRVILYILALLFIGQTKPNQPMQPIPQTPKFTPFT